MRVKIHASTDKITKIWCIYSGFMLYVCGHVSTSINRLYSTTYICVQLQIKLCVCGGGLYIRVNCTKGIPAPVTLHNYLATYVLTSSLPTNLLTTTTTTTLN